MLRTCLVVLAVLTGMSFSFAGDGRSALAQAARWGEARKLLAEGNAAAAKAAFEELLAKFPEEPDLHLFLGITQLRLRNPDAAVVALFRRSLHRSGGCSADGYVCGREAAQGTSGADRLA